MGKEGGTVRISVEFIGLPALVDICGCKRELEISSDTIMGVVSQLVRLHGEGVGEILLENGERLDDSILVMVNGSPLTGREDVEQHHVQEGDHIVFLLPAGGG